MYWGQYQVPLETMRRWQIGKHTLTVGRWWLFLLSKHEQWEHEHDKHLERARQLAGGRVVFEPHLVGCSFLSSVCVCVESVESVAGREKSKEVTSVER